MRILNKHTDRIPKDSVYIGRPSKWGNPYSHLPKSLATNNVATREVAIQLYENWIRTQTHLLDDLPELVGKDLVCFCAPLSCHGEVLIKLLKERGFIDV